MISVTGSENVPTMVPSSNVKMEVWGGAECTLNRVQDRYFDQMQLSGHDQRLDDFDLFAKLGIGTLRVGMLWERHELDASWNWSDDRLARIRDLGVRPIVGFMHHGSGPRNTSLMDPAFPEKMAAYAEAFAERYPWVDAYTPINEPNTTARFSGLYGVWYPHRTSRNDYLRALIHELKAIVLSMAAIRRVRPDAQLIQTDDVGTIRGTEELQHVWRLLNLRQWLPFDLLCGRVDRNHPLFDYMRISGISEKDIFWFTEHSCPPNILGINYYVTSDRHLDHRIDIYPGSRRSAEGLFVDVEAVRARPDGIVGVESIITAAWDRYRVPIALTEVHLGCTVDEQIRWLVESWHGAARARHRGVECLAITPWALLGSFYWNELVTRANGHYEAGVFDISKGWPETTDLASVVAQLARGRVPQHSSLSQPGWWHNPNRICFPYGEEIAA